MTYFRDPSRTRPKLASFRAGHIFLMPAAATWLNRDKPRPFALAGACSISQPGILTYGSTRITEMSMGAACIEVPPLPSGVNANGLMARTMFYPGVLFQVVYERLPSHLGSLGKLIPEFKDTIRRALGIGSGSCLHPEAPSGSRRGQIVRLQDESAIDFRTRFAVVLTEHVYSREKHYDVLIPIYHADRLPASAHGLPVEGREWLRIFAQPSPRGLVAVHLIQSVWYGTDIAAETQYVIDDATLEIIEAELCMLFDLVV
jgi:hypothetical protein